MPETIQLANCAEGDSVVYNGQKWRVGGIRKGGRVLYGITRRTILDLPGTTLVTRGMSDV